MYSYRFANKLLIFSLIVFAAAGLCRFLLNNYTIQILTFACEIKNCDNSDIFLITQKIHAFKNEILFLGIYALLSGVLIIILIKYSLLNRIKIDNKNIIYFLVGINLLITILYSVIVLQCFPNSSDEFSYLFQAKTMLNGSFWNSVPPISGLFHYNHSFMVDGKWVGRFPPGWPLMLAGFLKLTGNSVLLNPILSSLTLYVQYQLAKTIFNQKTAIITSIVLLFSSFYIFNSASYFSHTSALLFVLLFYYCGYKFIEKGFGFYAILAGFSIGFAFLIRPYTALLLSAPFIIIYLRQVIPWKIPKGLWFILGFLPAIIFLMLYNYKITGDPFLLVTKWNDPAEGIGFVKGHNMFTGILYLGSRLLDFISWASPSLLFLFPVCQILAYKKKWYWGNVFSSTFLILILGYIFFHSYGGNQYGPRFYFEAYPFLILAIVSALFYNIEKTHPKLSNYKLIFLYGFLFTVLSIPRNTIIENKVIKERMDVFIQAEEMELDNAIIILENGTGLTRPMGVGDLVRNDPDIKNTILYIKNPGTDNYQNLIENFPGRNIYIYTRELNKVKGELVAY